METETSRQTGPVLSWRVHLLKRQPRRLPVLVLVVFIGGACVWLMFGQVLPTAAAIALLLGSAIEYLTPVTYRLTPQGAELRGVAVRADLSWDQLRRCFPDPVGLVLTPLLKPSRLDCFRGILLRYAPDGEPGDRASVLSAISHLAPSVSLQVPTETSSAAEPGATPSERGVRA